MAQVNQTLLNGESSTELMTRRNKLASTAKRNLNTNTIDFDHIKRLETVMEEMSLHTENESGGTINHLLTGIFQADLLIAKRFIKGESQCIVSSDGDFAMMVGEKLIMVKEFHYYFKKKKIKNITLFFSSDDIAKESNEVCISNDILRGSLEYSKYSFFSDYHDLETRALIVFALGCNVYKGGIKGVGPEKIQKFIDDNETTNMN